MQVLAFKIAAGLKKRVPDHPSSIEELQFSLEALFNTFGTLFLALTLSLLTGHTHETIFALLSFAILRAVSGGIHLKYSWTCCLASSIVANIVSFSSVSHLATVCMTIISIILALIYAPSRIEQQTRIPERYFPLLKFISVIFICSNFYFESSIMAVSVLIQCVLLIRKGGDHTHEN
ncbi:accessory gene regulator B [Paenibacillus baekrokdamisoli]|uniref:accessory gene regulator B family protein n=1 Tax=Paenibacillus baekrokdamisoli TaxID=1712516 RepID=UPI000F78E8E6|nr:accessory gene regulator B family protein [Paenibacillus baekrokdamisoli]MBB3069318.1 accessory gene regulator B [Paenibacillus baekrokdamisoli]